MPPVVSSVRKLGIDVRWMTLTGSIQRSHRYFKLVLSALHCGGRKEIATATQTWACWGNAAGLASSDCLPSFRFH